MTLDSYVIKLLLFSYRSNFKKGVKKVIGAIGATIFVLSLAASVYLLMDTIFIFINRKRFSKY